MGGLLFALAHFYTFFNLVAIFPSYLFPFVIDDTHIIGPTSIVSRAFHHFSSQLDLVTLQSNPVTMLFSLL
jgi:hypothetical protein